MELKPFLSFLFISIAIVVLSSLNGIETARSRLNLIGGEAVLSSLSGIETKEAEIKRLKSEKFYLHLVELKRLFLDS